MILGEFAGPLSVERGFTVRMAVWPETLEDHGCGEFKAKKP